MARKKNKGGGGKRRGNDSSDDDEEVEQTKDNNTTDNQTKKQSRKEKRLAKQQKHAQQQHHDDDDDDDDIDAILLPSSKNDYGASESEEEFVIPQPATSNKNRNKKKGAKTAAAAAALALLADSSSSSSESEQQEPSEEEEEEIPQPPQPALSKKQKKKQQQREAMVAPSSSDEHDDEKQAEVVQEEDQDSDDDDVEPIAFKIVDIDEGDKPKKKKKKKEKKERKEKKKKKSKDQDEDSAGGHDKPKKKKKDHKKKSKNDKESTAPADDNGDVDKIAEQVHEHLHLEDKLHEIEEKPAAKKSKFELQMEAALNKKHQEEEKKQSDEKLPAKVEEQIVEPAENEAVEETKEEEEAAGSDAEELMYGAPDDVAWSDKSHAQRAAEAASGGDEEEIPTHDEHGKKLSNKQRKKLIKEREAAKRAAEYEASLARASKEGAQFACSQTAVNENDPQWENSLDINVPNFSISAAGKILFKDASLTIGHGRRYGLVGPNGKGKSTLLKMIASGDLKIPPRVDFLYVEQEVVADNTPAVDAVLKADKKRWDLLQEEKILTRKVDEGDESPDTIDRLQYVIDELTQMGAASAEAKARRILYGLGFDVEMQTKPTKMFSGGWRMRISLARALFIEPTLLMLDEPTNHLDLNAVIWLDDYLQRWKKTLLVVSHDQDFLNSVCQEILHIEDLKLISYKGNYDSFKRAEKIRFEQQVKAWEQQEKRLKALKRSGQSKAKAAETVKKNTKREPGARSQKKKNDAIAAGTEAAEQTELIKRPREYMVKLEFTGVAELSRPVMEVNRVHFRYSPKNPVIFDEIDFGIDMDSRICVVGPNGAGKSTLLKLLTGEVNPTTGEVRRNPRLRMGIYNQHFVDRLPMDKTPVEHLRDRFNDEDYQSIRNRLGKYGLEGHAHEVTMRDLSGGQKARVVFVELSLQRPHILLLDEPTNNLDIETIDALIDAINEFNGGIVVVTHDQRLIDECDCTLWVVEKQGVTAWEAGFDDYKETLLQQMEEAVEKEAAIRQQKLDAAATARAEKLARLQKKVKK